MATKKKNVPNERRILPPATYMNQFLVRAGQNLPNHVTTLSGRGKFVACSSPDGWNNILVFRTRQEAYRLVAWLLAMVDAHALPDEQPIAPDTGMILADGEPYTYEEIEAHVHNS